MPIIAYCTLDAKRGQYARARLDGDKLCGEYRYDDQPPGEHCVALSELQSVGAFHEVTTPGMPMYMDDVIQPWTCKDMRGR